MATEKMCAVCKKDCSAGERIKDKKGRYFHKSCYERAKKAALARQKQARSQAAPRPAAAPVAASAPASCPNCNMMMPPGGVQCTTCGYNTQTGELMPVLASVKFDNTPPKRSSSGPKVRLPSGSFSGLLKNPLAIWGGVVGFFGVMLLIGMANPGVLAIYFLAWAVFAFGVGVWVLVDAFQESAMDGVLCLVCGPYSLYYATCKTTNQNLKIGYVVALLLWGGFFLAGSQLDPSDFDLDDAAYYDGSYDDSGFDDTDPFADETDDAATNLASGDADE